MFCSNELDSVTEKFSERHTRTCYELTRISFVSPSLKVLSVQVDSVTLAVTKTINGLSTMDKVEVFKYNLCLTT